MEQRDISMKAVERATGISHTNLWCFKFGKNLPRLETALRMVDALEWPKLGEIIREARSDRCQRPGCQVEFVNEGGSPKRYCSADCRKLAEQMREATDQGPGRLLAAVRAELARVHGTTGAISRKALKAAADEYAYSGSKRGRRVTAVQEQLDTAKAAASAFCRSCEPDGLCKTPACELRVISPLALVGDDRDVARATKAAGAWGNETNRANQLVAIRAANARRWTPEERVAQALATRRRWDALTPEQRAERGRLISERRRAAS
jgi:hypothetical protein